MPLPGPSQFSFMCPDFREVADPAIRAEALALVDPRGACFYSRRALEVLVNHVYNSDTAFQRPWETQLASLLAAPCFAANVPPHVVAKAKVIRDLGNLAVHGKKPIRQFDAIGAVRELFHVCFWFARTYSKAWPPENEFLTFDQAKLMAPPTPASPPVSLEQLRKLQEELKAKDDALRAGKEQIEKTDAEIRRLQQEVAAAKARANQTPDKHDYSEAATRDAFIDILLREAGWGLDGWTDGQDIEVRVEGMPNTADEGFADYVLWGDDGKPLAVVEAKRTKRDARVGQQQARLYADCLEKEYGRRPIIFCTNGYQHWIWDDHFYPPREVGGFYTKDELQRLIARRSDRVDPQTIAVNRATVDRAYQTESIREMAANLMQARRKGLLVMATGTGKTRTVVALVELLQRAGWVKNTLFLADRLALVKQATNAFKKHLPDSSPVNLILQPEETGRVYVSTYPTILNLIERERDKQGVRRFGPGFFDLVVIDEAHRSVYQKYRAIFEYFDSLLVGLTATPRSEVDRDTYGLFDLSPGIPTFAYELDEAVKDGFLVPPRGTSVDLAFPQRGIKYDELSQDEKDQWDEIEWDEDDPQHKPREVDAEAVNRWLFNKDTVDKALAYLMEHGIKVAGGDRLGKTIIFAKSKDHARFIEERFNIQYPGHRGVFARVIDHYEQYAHHLLDEFSIKDKAPHIAISVDMLDTGVDVPEVVNLVFFKMVRSKTKFWQMVGRGTRLCPDLFGPGQDKDHFRIFDFCRNLEYFNQDLPDAEGKANESLQAQIFHRRLDIHRMTRPAPAASSGRAERPARGLPESEAPQYRTELADALHSHVKGMTLDNVIVRRKRAMVERFSDRERWSELSEEDYAHVGDSLAALPTNLPPEDETARRFDLLMLRAQLALAEHHRSFTRLKEQAQEIAARLAEKRDIPVVAAQMELILDLAQDEWWENVTLPILERTRRRLRDLVQFIDKSGRAIIYTDFEDTLGGATEIPLAGVAEAVDAKQYRAKMLAFLKAHENHIAVRRIRMGEALTPSDLDELDRLLFVTSGLGDRATFERAYGSQPKESLADFIRSLVGMDREAAKRSFGEFLADSRLTAPQIRFINMLIEELTRNGKVSVDRLYESPYTDASPEGLDGVFDDKRAGKILKILDALGNAPGARKSG